MTERWSRMNTPIFQINQNNLWSGIVRGKTRKTIGTNIAIKKNLKNKTYDT